MSVIAVKIIGGPHCGSTVRRDDISQFAVRHYGKQHVYNPGPVVDTAKGMFAYAWYNDYDWTKV